jgi:hypothetical protein
MKGINSHLVQEKSIIFCKKNAIVVFQQVLHFVNALQQSLSEEETILFEAATHRARNVSTSQSIKSPHISGVVRAAYHI